MIARDWSLLMPVRSYCEALGIPVQTASHEQPSFWRLRETQALLGWIQGRQGGLLSVHEIAAWLDQYGRQGWWATIHGAIDEFATEHGEGGILTKDLLEWLAEWGRDFRRLQTGLLLLTAHRAKGLEFDHVVVLDGNWDRRGQGEDRDAARRLFYVAMTRAKLGLTLMARNVARHPILPPAGDSAFLIRGEIEPGADTSVCRKLYQTLELRQIDLSFAGRLPEGHPSLHAIERLRVGDD